MSTEGGYVDFDAMTRDEKIELLKLLNAKEFQEKDKTLQNRKYSLIQEAYLCSTAKITLLSGSNRSGKSTAGGDKTTICATGVIPDCLVGKFPERLIQVGEYWCSALSSELSYTVSEAKIKSVLPSASTLGENKERRTLYLRNGSEIGFKSCEQGRDKYQGVSKRGQWDDEEHQEVIWDEQYMRSVDCSGWMTLTFTPIEGLTWAYKKLYKMAGKYVSTINIHGIPEDVGIVHTPEEIKLLKDRKLVEIVNSSADADPNIVVYTAAIYDNSFLPDAEIQYTEKKFKNDIGAYNARVLGRFTQLSGNKVFHVPTLLKMQSSLSTNFKNYTLYAGMYKPDPRGRLTIFKDKKPNGHYVIGADVAEGLEIGDNSCAQILDRHTCEQIAVWHGKVSPEKFADVLNDLGRIYNTAMLGPERNFHGFGVVNRLRDFHKYPNLYYHYKLEDQILSGRPAQKKTYGWETNAKTKPIMIQELAAYIRDGHLKINDYHTIDELITYIYSKEGKLEAMGGCYDDRVIALAIALQLFKRTSITLNSDTHTPTPVRVSERMGY